MISQTIGDLTLLRFERLSREPGLVHAVTTKPANLAPHRGVARDRAMYWRQRACEILGVPFDKLTLPAQVHGADCLRIEDRDIGRGRDGRDTAVPFVDGLITDRPGVPIALLSADCPLICAYDPDRPAIGAVHASWRGTVGGAAGQMVRLMQREFASDPARLHTALAPSAGPCCYEVSEDIRRVARTRLSNADACFIERDSRLTFDLWTANRLQLIEAGVPADHIEVAGLCSICDPRLWSHRRDGPDAGRFTLFIALR